MDSREAGRLSVGDLIVVTVEKGGGMRTLGAEVLSVHPPTPPGKRGKPGKAGKLRVRLFLADLYRVRTSTQVLALKPDGIFLGLRWTTVREAGAKEIASIKRLKGMASGEEEESAVEDSGEVPA